MNESGADSPPSQPTAEKPQPTPESLQTPPPLSDLPIPDRNDREKVLGFLREETLDQLESLKKQYPALMADLDKKLEEIPQEYYYHKAHTSPHLIDPAYHIVRLILYDRYIAETPQFVQSSDPAFLALAVVTTKGHDTGFTVSSKNHEEESVKITTELMRKHGFMTDKIPDVEEAILATKLEYVGQNLSEKQIESKPLLTLTRDTDFANLGEEEEENKLMTTLVAMEAGKDPNDQDFLQFTLDLMKRHQYYTEAAKYLLEDQKVQNIQALEERIQKAKAQNDPPTPPNPTP